MLRLTSLSIIVALLLMLEFASCRHEVSDIDKPYITLDSTFVKVDDSLFAKTYFDDSLHIGSLVIYKLTDRELLFKIQSIDSLPSFMDGPIFEINEVTDYNNDGLNDLTINYCSGARGSNVLDYLFIQKKDSVGNIRFQYVRGSDYPPNLYFDTSRRVVTATMFHGGVTFADFLVVDDSLVKIGSVDVSGYDKWVIRVYNEVDSTGQSIEVGRDSVYDGWENFFSRDP